MEILSSYFTAFTLCVFILCITGWRLTHNSTHSEGGGQGWLDWLLIVTGWLCYWGLRIRSSLSLAMYLGWEDRETWTLKEGEKMGYLHLWEEYFGGEKMGKPALIKRWQEEEEEVTRGRALQWFGRQLMLHRFIHVLISFTIHNCSFK